MLIALDAGHGGSDPGAVYNGRQEKDDNLALAMAVGDILEKKGVNIVYTRTNDIYETPFKKATDANEAGADYFVSFHRNSSETPGNATGVQTLIFSDGGPKEKLARNIQDNLTRLGFNDLGISIRPNLVVLKRTQMPAVLIETGFINNDSDNSKFDDDFDEIADAIADGILQTIGYGEETMAAPVAAQAEYEGVLNNSDFDYDEDYEEYNYNDGMMGTPEERENRNRDITDDNDEELTQDKCQCDKLYRVQVGAYRNREYADRLLSSLLALEFPAFIIYSDGLYKVQVGAYKLLDNAVRMERKLRRYRYSTYITT